jgi:hypothetical protein
MRTLALLSLAVALVQDPPSAPSGGKIAWGKDPAAAEKRARLEQRAMLLYFTDGGLPSKALDAGALSAAEVTSAARRVLPVILECADDKAHADWRMRLKVAAFPTIAILEPDGKTYAEITVREPADVAAEILKTARRFPGRDVLWVSSIESGMERAKDEPKPLALYFHGADDDLGAAQERLVKLAGQSRVDKFIWVELTATLDDKDPLKSKYDILTLPAIAFIDPRFNPPKQFGIYDLKEKTKPKDLQDKLEDRLKKYKDTRVKK